MDRELENMVNNHAAALRARQQRILMAQDCRMAQKRRDDERKLCRGMQFFSGALGATGAIVLALGGVGMAAFAFALSYCLFRVAKEDG